MAIVIEGRVRIGWVGDGTGSSLIGGNQANIPGAGTGGTSFRPVFLAQVLELQQAEAVPGGDTPTLANLTTALSSLGTDLASQLTAAIIAQIDGWATGSP